MNVEAPKTWRTPFALVGGSLLTLSAVTLAVCAVDAFAYDFIDGDNPMEKTDGNFRSVLRDFNEKPSEILPSEQWSVHQRIASVGGPLTGLVALYTFSFRNLSIGTALTLTAHAGVEVVDGVVSADSIRSLFFTGAGMGTLGGALVTIGTEPKSFIDQAKDGIEKAKKVASKVTGSKK